MPKKNQRLTLNQYPKVTSEVTFNLHQKIIDDLEIAFEKALQAEQYSAAIRAKELQLRELTNISEHIQGQIKKISEMSEEELAQIMD